MKKSTEVKKEFNRKLNELEEEIKPSLTGNNRNDLVIYDKLLEIQEQLNRIRGERS